MAIVMSESKPSRKPRPARPLSVQLEAARRARGCLLVERNLLVAILAATNPAHLMPPKRAQTWQHVVCIHSPVGAFSWQLTNEEAAEDFASLETAPNHGESLAWPEKMARLREWRDALQSAPKKKRGTGA